MSGQGSSVGSVRLLAYQERRPHLQVIRLPEIDWEPCSVRVDKGEAALHPAIRRDGWIALKAHEEVWALPLPLGEEAHLVARSLVCVPGVDSQTVWIEDRSAAEVEGERTFVRLDASGRNAEERIRLPGRLAVAVRGGFVFQAEGGLQLRSSSGRDCVFVSGSNRVVASSPDMIAARRGNVLVLARPGADAIEVPSPTGGEWHLFSGTFSPNGTRFAHAVRTEADTETHEETQEAPRRVVDTRSGDVTVVAEPFENVACMPVWSPGRDSDPLHEQ